MLKGEYTLTAILAFRHPDKRDVYLTTRGPGK
jgi:hypothetical protein